MGGLLFLIMKVVVYIDGFNLYYGVLKKSPYKWLNIEAFVKNILPDYYSIVCIKYFTARISPAPEDLTAPSRQALYIRALKTLSSVQIYEGHFLAHAVYMPLIPQDYSLTNPIQQMRTVRVLKREEKRRDQMSI